MPPSPKLMNRNFALLWLGQTVSVLGSQVFSIAILYWMKDHFDSASVMGLVLMIGGIPAILISPLGGTFADRYPRRTIMIVTDTIKGLLMVSLAAMMLLNPPKELTLVWIVVVAVIGSVMGVFFRPAITAAIPDLVAKHQLIKANGLLDGSADTATFLGQSAAGVLLRIFGAPFLILFDGITYLFSAASEYFIQLPKRTREKTHDSLRALMGEYTRETLEGFRYIRRQPGMVPLFLAVAVSGFFDAPILILLPFYVSDFMQAQPDWFGYLYAAMGVGSVVGYFAAGWLHFSPRVNGLFLMLALPASAVILVVLGQTAYAPIILALFFLTGLIEGIHGINILTILQLAAPEELRGRIVGTIGVLGRLLVPFSMGLVGVITDLLDQRIPLLFAIYGGSYLAITLALCLNRNYRTFLTTPQSPDP